ncbi:unnamed protein product [Coffea canephora]|uniref:Uncharacterized protein n=1 Tax=Coffea canephora TaxID=49390 RepID=A0A068USK6_COFCA|nr:unnamed protein product [Coffea canephora]
MVPRPKKKKNTVHGYELSILLEQGRYSSIAERMQDYQVIAMVIFLGPKLKFIQDQIQENVKNLMSQQLRIPSGSSGR